MHRLLSSLSGLVVVLIATLLGPASVAEAIPLFARQTGVPCGHCHAPPPVLTPFGRRFMLGGYSLAGERKPSPPLSIFLFETVTASNTDLEQRPGKNAGRNNNALLQVVSLRTGGAIGENTGAHLRFDYNGLDEQFKAGTYDLRHVGYTLLGQTSVLYGITVHNNPTSQDPWNSTALKAWPYFYSAVEPRPDNTPIRDGALGNRVLGTGGYLFLDDSLYLELTAYTPLALDRQSIFGANPGSDTQLDDTAWYARIAREYVHKHGTVTLGASGFAGDISHGPSGEPSDRVEDIGVDILYQRSRGPHALNLGANILYQDSDSSESRSAGFALNGSNELQRFSASASWIYSQVFGLGVGYTGIDGSRDTLFRQTRNGRPDSSSWRFDVFYNPLTKNPPAWDKWMRARIGLQYIMYDTFNGAANNYDGTGRDARDNNTVTLYLTFTT